MTQVRKYIISLLLLFGRFSPNSTVKTWIAGAGVGFGFAGMGATQLLSLLGFSAVSHSSGAMILTGAGGYIAGTYGVAMLVALLTAPLALFIYAVCIIIGVFAVLKKRLGSS